MVHPLGSQNTKRPTPVVAEPFRPNVVAQAASAQVAASTANARRVKVMALPW